ncbi:hypothetical protein B6S44_15060 [Bosea sp. Tri-44]|nr:hypothetical protein B6S44_15060 [Bosea sp. Tri-44]
MSKHAAVVVGRIQILFLFPFNDHGDYLSLIQAPLLSRKAIVAILRDLERDSVCRAAFFQPTIVN